MQTTKYSRRPFDIDAVKVTAENISEVAVWCNGTVETAEDKSYIKVQVHRPLTERQTRAFVGDWVLYAGRGYKVYTEVAFTKNFVPAAAPVVHPPTGVRTVTRAELGLDESGAGAGLTIPKPGPPPVALPVGLHFQ